jgi:TolB-like protein/DNA-binding winged helix-turn-helix (wHTH) protein/Tfp pilus assembly protein PilF
MFVLGSAYLDPDKQLLTIGSSSVTLQRKPYQVLVCLIENRHRMVYREELLERFWDGKDVYDQSLSKAIGSIRKALGEPQGSEFIETRWGLGYRYVGPFEELPSGAGVTDPTPRPADTTQKTEGPAEAETPAIAEPSAEVLADETKPAPPAAVETARPWLPSPLGMPARVWLVSFLAVFTILMAVIALYAHRLHILAQASAAVPGDIQSLAVLPFTAEGNQEEDQYLGPGLADAVAAKLDTVPQLLVRSSTTVQSILGPHPDPASAGSKLKVQALVSGEIRRVDKKLEITVRLLDSATGADLWSGHFNTDNSNIFKIEDSIAEQVSSALIPQFKMTTARTGAGTTQPEAYAKYMKAEFFANQRTQSSVAKAIDLLHEVIGIDPRYARAYAALSNCYTLQGFYHFASPSEAYPRAKAAALKALSIDNSLAEAHVSLLSELTDYEWDWQGAEQEFKAAIAIDPNYAVAYQYYGYALFGRGRGEEGLAAMKHAAELDPVSPSVLTSVAWGYYLLRQEDQAVEQCKRVLELYPDFVPAHQLLGLADALIHQDRQSMAELNLARSLEKDGPITPILVDYELARSGRRAEASRELAAVITRSRGGAIPDYYIAAAWEAAGNPEQAQIALNRAYQVRSNWLIYLPYDPRFDALRPDPQFQALLHKVEFSRE